jgi:hypothetical protein
MAIFGAVNIFYAIYSLTQRDAVGTVIPTFTFLVLMYSAAILDEKAEEASRQL